MQKQIDNIEQRITKYEDEIDLLWPAWRELDDRLQKLERFVIMQAIEIDKLKKLAGVM